MLEEAKKLALLGRAVYIIAVDEQERRRIALLLGNESPYNNKFGIKVETTASLGNFDWNNLSLQGAHYNCTVLVDHYAIEKHIGEALLTELTRYDDKIEIVKKNVNLKRGRVFITVMVNGKKKHWNVAKGLYELLVKLIGVSDAE